MQINVDYHSRCIVVWILAGPLGFRSGAFGRPEQGFQVGPGRGNIFLRRAGHCGFPRRAHGDFQFVIAPQRLPEIIQNRGSSQVLVVGKLDVANAVSATESVSHLITDQKPIGAVRVQVGEGFCLKDSRRLDCTIGLKVEGFRGPLLQEGPGNVLGVIVVQDFNGNGSSCSG